jgi:hypothetical protein
MPNHRACGKRRVSCISRSVAEPMELTGNASLPAVTDRPVPLNRTKPLPFLVDPLLLQSNPQCH